MSDIRPWTVGSGNVSHATQAVRPAPSPGKPLAEQERCRARHDSSGVRCQLDRGHPNRHNNGVFYWSDPASTEHPERERSYSECSACGMKDDPRRTTCLHCGGQTQVFSEHPERRRWERFTIRADGPDGRVDHFYADTDLHELEVAPASEVDALQAKLQEAEGRVTRAERFQANRIADIQHWEARARSAEERLERLLRAVDELGSFDPADSAIDVLLEAAREARSGSLPDEEAGGKRCLCDDGPDGWKRCPVHTRKIEEAG
jgi:hypothetical protein